MADDIFSAELDGLAELARNTAIAEAELVIGATAGLVEHGEIVMGRSKDEFCPVDVGALKSTGHVEPPKISHGEIEVGMAYGGPSGVPTKDGKDYVGYALWVHEGTKHLKGRKYLEQPAMEEAPQMAPRIEEHVAERLASRLP